MKLSNTSSQSFLVRGFRFSNPLRLLNPTSTVNVLVVVGSERLYSDMLRRFNGQRIGANGTTTVIKVDRSGGSVDRDEDFLRRSRHALVRQYFYGDPKVSLSPHMLQVDYNQLNVYKVPEG